MIKPVLGSTTSTQYERRGLDRGINLSDGHTRQPLTPSQEEIISRFPALFKEAQNQSQFDLEEEFIDAFLQLACQSRVYGHNRYLLSYSSSSAIKMLASYCRKAGKTVALIEPAFDNIPNTLKYEGVPLEVLPEEWLGGTGISQRLGNLSSEVIWIVNPNNPTGRTLSQLEFTELVNFCAQNGKLLICDFCFRFFSQEMLTWDQYKILKSSNVSYATIEDTGKTWSTLDMKLGMLVCSEDLYPEMYAMHDDLLLNVSPFHLKILTEFIHDTYSNGLNRTILHYVNLNRSTLHESLSGSVLEPLISQRGAVTMEWIKINAPFTSEDLWKALIRHGIHILPGSNFYWNSPERGQRFIRIPLTRDPKLLEQALPVIKQVSSQLACGGFK